MFSICFVPDILAEAGPPNLPLLERDTSVGIMNADFSFCPCGESACLVLIGYLHSGRTLALFATALSTGGIARFAADVFVFRPAAWVHLTANT